jgi:hypothetical protein
LETIPTAPALLNLSSLSSWYTCWHFT